MLGVSFSELAITCIVAFVLMRPQDIKKFAYWYKYFSKQIMELRATVQDSLDEINKDLEEEKTESTVTKTDYVISKNNRLQKTYDDNPLAKND
ncbi:MAG: twin-arginine translocase TatA/TatE family subunit [Rickettsiales bacterium]|nr:twin-arginine translocase TatA/TatE family subunit [Rickettsiales bacterium]